MRQTETHLSCSLVQADGRPQVLLRYGPGCINLVSENEEGDLAQLLDAQQRIELGPRLAKALVVLRVDHEDNAVNFWEVVLPQAARLLVAAKVVGGKLDGADGQLF